MIENLIGEVWKDIPGFEGLYQVSNLCRVKSLCKKSNNISGSFRHKNRFYPERILNQRVNRSGYFDCVLRVSGKSHPYTIHRLVALAWILNPNSLPEVHHKNHNKLDNSIENLEWVTSKKNSELAVENGRYNFKPTKSKKIRLHKSSRDIPEYYMLSGDLKGEIWMDITNFEGYYKISNYGRVRNIRYSKILKPRISLDGYLSFQLQKNGISEYISSQRLVAIHFIPNLENKPCVHHRDVNISNNHTSNLEWVTHQENRDYAVLCGNLNVKGENCTSAKFTNSQVLFIRENVENKSIGKLATEFKVSRKCISDILRRKSWAHI